MIVTNNRIIIKHDFIKGNIPYLVVPFLLKNKHTKVLTSHDIGELFLKDEARPIRMSQNSAYYLMTFKNEICFMNFCEKEMPMFSGHIVGISVQTSDIPAFVGNGENEGYVINPMTDHIIIKV